MLDYLEMLWFYNQLQTAKSDDSSDSGDFQGKVKNIEEQLKRGVITVAQAAVEIAQAVQQYEKQQVAKHLPSYEDFASKKPEALIFQAHTIRDSLPPDDPLGERLDTLILQAENHTLDPNQGGEELTALMHTLRKRM